MASRHSFRFGVVAAQVPSAEAWIASARRAEELGFSTFAIPDTLGPTLAPIPALTAVAMATRTLRVGTYVLANDVRNPVLLACEAAALAAREADVVALGVSPQQGEAVFQEKIDTLRTAAGARFDQIELNVNLAAVGDQVHPWTAQRFGVTLEQLKEIGSPSTLLGTPDEMCEQLEARRERLGISYVNCGADMMDMMAPVVARLAGR